MLINGPKQEGSIGNSFYVHKLYNKTFITSIVFRENILKTAKALVEDTKNLVSGAASSQEKLAQAAQSSAKTITQLTDVVKLGAASIGPDDPETQVRAMEKVMRTNEKSNTGIYQHQLIGHLSGMHMCYCHSSPRRWC